MFLQTGSALKKLFEDGAVKREENSQPTLEVQIVKHAYRGNSFDKVMVHL